MNIDIIISWYLINMMSWWSRTSHEDRGNPNVDQNPGRSNTSSVSEAGADAGAVIREPVLIIRKGASKKNKFISQSWYDSLFGLETLLEVFTELQQLSVHLCHLNELLLVFTGFIVIVNVSWAFNFLAFMRTARRATTAARRSRRSATCCLISALESATLPDLWKLPLWASMISNWIVVWING